MDLNPNRIEAERLLEIAEKLLQRQISTAPEISLFQPRKASPFWKAQIKSQPSSTFNQRRKSASTTTTTCTTFFKLITSARTSNSSKSNTVGWRCSSIQTKTGSLPTMPLRLLLMHGLITSKNQFMTELGFYSQIDLIVPSWVQQGSRKKNWKKLIQIKIRNKLKRTKK